MRHVILFILCIPWSLAFNHMLAEQNNIFYAIPAIMILVFMGKLIWDYTVELGWETKREVLAKEEAQRAEAFRR